MLRTFLAAALLLLTLVFHPGVNLAGEPHSSLPAAGSLESLGVNIHFTDPRPGELEMLAAGGFHWIRMDLHWSATEPQPGKYDFSAYDRLIKALDAHKLRPVFILCYQNRHYSSERAVRTEEARQAYAKWATAAVAHFQGRGILWEIWNEPNISGFWKPQPNSQEYTAMALAACKAVRAAHPRECLIGPATSRVDLQFLEDCFRTGLLEYWDAVSVHPYRQSGPESAAGEYAQLRQLIAKYAPANRNIPILSAEWGYSAAWHKFDAERQGKMLPRELLTNLSNGIPLSIWYDWHNDGEDPKEAEHNFGIVEFPYFKGRQPVYNPKPAYVAMQTLTSTLRQFQFSRRLATESSDHYVLLFQHNQAQRLAVWSTRPGPQQLVLPASAGDFELVSASGQRSRLTAGADGLQVSLDDSVQYLIPAAPNAGLAAIPTAHPLVPVLAPRPGLSVPVLISNPTQEAFEGQVILQTSSNIKASTKSLPVSFAKGETSLQVEFPLNAKLPEAGELGLTIENRQHQTLLSLPQRRYRMVPAGFWKTATVTAEGDPAVASQQELKRADQPAGWPASSGPVYRLDYTFQEGWKYLNVQTGDARFRAIPDQPQGFGLWISGEFNESLAARMRLIDSAGQTWQPSGPSLTGAGWQFVQMPLTPETAGWGGPQDHVIHYPLKWGQVFLLDNVSKQARQGSVLIAAPVVFY